MYYLAKKISDFLFKKHVSYWALGQRINQNSLSKSHAKGPFGASAILPHNNIHNNVGVSLFLTLSPFFSFKNSEFDV